MQRELFQSDQVDGQTGPLVGCAGWGLSSANRHLFPDMKSHLESYALVLPCVEINTSFYRLHRAETYARWRDSVPDSFRFSVKLVRTITHFKRLEHCESELAQFLDTVRPLGEKWGCLLVQFPPSFAYPGTLAQGFFSRLRELVPVDIACEPRHPTWFEDEVVDWMVAAGISYVEADPVPARCGKPIDARQPIRYVRLHGSPHIYHSSYPEGYLARLAHSLHIAYAAGQRSWCILDNTASGAAIDNALFLLSKVQQA